MWDEGGWESGGRERASGDWWRLAAGGYKAQISARTDARGEYKRALEKEQNSWTRGLASVLDRGKCVDPCTMGLIAALSLRDLCCIGESRQEACKKPKRLGVDRTVGAVRMLRCVLRCGTGAGWPQSTDGNSPVANHDDIANRPIGLATAQSMLLHCSCLLPEPADRVQSPCVDSRA